MCMGMVRNDWECVWEWWGIISKRRLIRNKLKEVTSDWLLCRKILASVSDFLTIVDSKSFQNAFCWIKKKRFHFFFYIFLAKISTSNIISAYFSTLYHPFFVFRFFFADENFLLTFAGQFDVFFYVQGLLQQQQKKWKKILSHLKNIPIS